MKQYNPKEIEPKWQKIWDDNTEFWQAKDFSQKPKFYTLFEFPYPSGEGLHMGHLRGQTAVDVYARKKRLEGFNVLTPIGWDAFGLPTENYAIKNKIHPAIATRKNIESIKAQEKMLGYFLDWPREINTTDPKYYKWTQWIFLQFFKKGLAYKADMPINWCPSCKIGLANEEVIDESCERCGTKTSKRNINQWLLRITKYADKLLDGLKDLDFPNRVKTQQINWIGKSEGTTVKFKIEANGLDNEIIEVFTTRVDTIFSAAFIVLAPEHKIVEKIKSTISNSQEVDKYIKNSLENVDFDRSQIEVNKTGVELKGVVAINPVNKEKIPVWISDFVLSQYGSGAVFADAHDRRDFEMAKKYNIPLKVSIKPKNEDLWKKVKNLQECFEGDGTLVNSGEFDGLSSAEARAAITKWLQEHNLGNKSTNFKLRDWIFSRQHYWGEPIPIIHCSSCGDVAVDEKDLPVLLPDVENYEPTDTGESPLAKITDWVNTKCPKCGGSAKRETDTMPNWAGSSWYFLRYLDPDNEKEFASEDKLKYWLPVDLYEGGMEHTTLHLLYSRFWNEFLYDIGEVPVSEPYKKRVPHGIILANDGRKMSKSFGNIVKPDEIVKKFGADTTRTYAMFIGPHDQAIAWNPSGLQGVWRFLKKVWENNLKDEDNENTELENEIQILIKEVSSDIENFKMNTAIAKLMEFNNLLSEQKQISKSIKIRFLRLLYPFAPHICEEMNEFLKEDYIFKSDWPEFNKSKLNDSPVTIVIQVNGKKKAVIECKKGLNKDQVIEKIRKTDKIAKEITGIDLENIVYIQDKILNIVKQS